MNVQAAEIRSTAFLYLRGAACWPPLRVLSCSRELFPTSPLPGPCHAGRPRRADFHGKPGVVLLCLSTTETHFPNRFGPDNASNSPTLQSSAAALVPPLSVDGRWLANGRLNARWTCHGRAPVIEPLAASPSTDAVERASRSFSVMAVPGDANRAERQLRLSPARIYFCGQVQAEEPCEGQSVAIEGKSAPRCQYASGRAGGRNVNHEPLK